MVNLGAKCQWSSVTMNIIPLFIAVVFLYVLTCFPSPVEMASINAMQLHFQLASFAHIPICEYGALYLTAAVQAASMCVPP